MLEEKLLDALCDQVEYRNGREIPIDPDEILKHYSMEEKKTKVCMDFIINYSRLDHPDTNFLFDYYPNHDIDSSRVLQNSFIGSAVGFLSLNPVVVLLAGLAGGLVTYRDERRYSIMNLKDVYNHTVIGAMAGFVIDSVFDYPGYFTNALMAAGFLYSSYKAKKDSGKTISTAPKNQDQKNRAIEEIKRRRKIKLENLYRLTLDDLEDIRKGQARAPYSAP